MLSFLKNHPFAVEAFFENATVLTFAVAKDQLKDMVPECLELDIFDGKWAFIAVAMVHTRDLRPKGFPRFLGNDFFLIGYRIFVRYLNNGGKNLRGLYILKSETNKKKMELLGNMFTQYSYTTIDLRESTINGTSTIKSIRSNFQVEIDPTEKEVHLPPNSPFKDWKEARRFAGPLPFTFTYNPKKKTVLIIEGVRENWTPRPLKVVNYNFSFFNTINIKNIVLANAFIIKNVPYSWKKGKIEKWNR